MPPKLRGDRSCPGRRNNPWLPLGGIALACLVIALLARLIPASLALRRAPLELAGGQE